jgi:hypothetical protein
VLLLAISLNPGSSLAVLNTTPRLILKAFLLIKLTDKKGFLIIGPIVS